MALYLVLCLHLNDDDVLENEIFSIFMRRVISFCLFSFEFRVYFSCDLFLFFFFLVCIHTIPNHNDDNAEDDGGGGCDSDDDVLEKIDSILKIL